MPLSKPPRLLLTSFSFAAVALAGRPALAQDDPSGSEPPRFPGWPKLSVVEQPGYPQKLRAADLLGDGRDQLIVVNPRHARLDIYQRTDPSEASDTAELAVNELPMAPGLKRTELPVRQPPVDAIALPSAAGRGADLLVLVASPNRLLRFTHDQETQTWTLAAEWDLLPGRYSDLDPILLVQPGTDPPTILIGGVDGVQTLTLPAADSDAGTSPQARWLEPRESMDLRGLWLADLDGDGRDDLVEWTAEGSRSLRWRAGGPTGFQPPRNLLDRGITSARILPAADETGRDELLVLESNPDGVVRRYRLEEGAESPLGARHPLPISTGDLRSVGFFTIDGQPAAVSVAADQPRLNLTTLRDGRWQLSDSFPSISGVKQIEAAPDPEAGTPRLLLWAQDAADLSWTRWENGRLLFPRPLGLAQDETDTKIVGLGSVGRTTWCVQKQGKDLVLFRWTGDSDTPSETRFVDAAGKAENTLWLGSDSLLVQDQFARNLRLITPPPTAEGQAQTEASKANSTEPAHLAKARIEEFALFETADGLRVGRYTDGVLQWLDASLRAVDQVMLPDGRRLDWITLGGDGEMWAIQSGGQMVHRLEADEAGVMRLKASTRVESGRALRDEPGLGLLLLGRDGLTQLTPGRSLELQVVQSLDGEDIEADGASDAQIHRVLAADLNGDGAIDPILSDDESHRFTALTRRPGSDELEVMLAWPVFEDRTYPYGGASDGRVAEPRAAVGLDLDGDGQQDLALLSHDRLLLYLSHADAPNPQAATDHE